MLFDDVASRIWFAVQHPDIGNEIDSAPYLCAVALRKLAKARS
jgi:hypothetical protein